MAREIQNPILLQVLCLLPSLETNWGAKQGKDRQLSRNWPMQRLAADYVFSN
jgi:hypothetical protein